MGMLMKLKKFLGRKRRDVLLFWVIPGVYNKYKKLPVNENKVVFVEIRLPEISNSFRVLYDEITKTGEYEVHAHFLRNSFVRRREYIKNCKEMVKDIATAKYVFQNESSDIISCLDLREETVITQLWHGCGAFKKFGLSTAEKIFGHDAKEQKRHPQNRNYTYVTVSSPEVVWAYAEAMDLKDQIDVIRPVGVSRTDVFFDEDRIKAAHERLYKLFPPAEGKKIILYAPTFRGRVAEATTPDCLDLKKFSQELEGEYVVIFKHHPIVKCLPVIPEEFRNSFAYDASKTMDIEDLICVSDICISDYSSLVFEYSLFERPMLFYAYDLDEYFDWRGFYYNYDELAPGPICKTNEDMISYIKNIESFDKQSVVDFKNKFMSACDGHATERIMQMVFGK